MLCNKWENIKIAIGTKSNQKDIELYECLSNQKELIITIMLGAQGSSLLNYQGQLQLISELMNYFDDKNNE
jgi:hypothetical protein